MQVVIIILSVLRNIILCNVKGIEMWLIVIWEEYFSCNGITFFNMQLT